MVELVDWTDLKKLLKSAMNSVAMTMCLYNKHVITIG